MVSRFQPAGGSIPQLGRGLANHVKRFVAPSRPDRFYRLRSRPRVRSQRLDRIADDDCVEHDELRLPGAKTGARAVPLSPTVKQVLTALPRRPDNPWVFPGRVRDTLLRILNASWQVVRGEAGLKDVRLHDLRRASATHPCRSPIREVIAHLDLAPRLVTEEPPVAINRQAASNRSTTLRLVSRPPPAPPPPHYDLLLHPSARCAQAAASAEAAPCRDSTLPAKSNTRSLTGATSSRPLTAEPVRQQ